MEENVTEDPENITLVPAEERTAKARCTIRTSRIKQEQESEDEADEVQKAIANAETPHKNVYMMELTSNSSNQSESLKLQPMADQMGKEHATRMSSDRIIYKLEFVLQIIMYCS